MKICMLLHKSVVHDSRVRREAKALAAAGHDVTVVHLPGERHASPFVLDGFRVVCATPRAWMRRALPLRAYRLAFLGGFVRAARGARPDVVHAHDAPMLAPALLATRLTRARLVYDSHELATGVPYRERFWARIVGTLERIALPRCAAVVTVSDGIAGRLQELYGLRERPVVVRNVPDTTGAVTPYVGLRERLGIGPAPVVLHQGALAPRRGCETLVDAVAQLPDTHLVFLGDAWPSYRGVVERFAAEAGALNRVHFLPNAPLEELLAYTRDADVGVSLLSDDCENHRLALPNKVFEYIAAGIPVVVSDLPELRRLVADRGVGRTADASDAAALAQAIAATLADREERRDALTRASAELTWEREAPRLTRQYERLGGKQRRALVFVRNPVTYDARVLREGRLLQDLGYETTIVGAVSTSEPSRETVISGIPVVRLAPGSLPWRRRRNADPAAPSTSAPVLNGGPPRPRRGAAARRLLLALDWYRRGIGRVVRTRPALVHCNDYNTMWIGVAAKLTGARVVYDSHELWPDRNLRPEPGWWLMLCEALFVRVADDVVTTSPGHAAVVARRYGIRPPRVVRNIPELVACGAPKSDHGPVALYFGAVTRHRGLEDAVATLRELPELSLKVIGPQAWAFGAELQAIAERLGVADRLDLLDPIPPERCGKVLGEADVGLALIQPVCRSYELALPNKLFEYTLAGLPTVATRLPVIEKFVAEHRLGVLVRPGDLSDLVASLRHALDPATNQKLRAAATAAAEKLTWQRESAQLVAAYESSRGDA